MKKLTLSVLAILFTSLSALAASNPNSTYPLYQARLTEVDAQGHEVNHGLEKNLILSEQDGATRPTQLTFTEESYNLCPMLYMPGYQCPTVRTETKEFKIESAEKGGCGEVTYVAREIQNATSSRPAAVMTLVDHTQDVCEYPVPATWVVKLQAPYQPLRTLQGNAERVITIQ